MKNLEISMAKVTLEFDSFEEAQDIQNALNGWKYKHFIYMFDQKQISDNFLYIFQHCGQG